jgi:predicted CXXCH cytochrome family protein
MTAQAPPHAQQVKRLCGNSVMVALITIGAVITIPGGCRWTDHEPGETAVYVGRGKCAGCHVTEYDRYQNSDHDRAMEVASDQTVLGNFHNASLTQGGVTTRFYRREGRFLVYTEGPEGHMGEFEVAYTFGVSPLQQYLVAFPGGRLQCLPFCWDTRPASDGGQRWFHIYGNERIAPDDVLFWTRITQNWNSMCAECHSTDLQKNYDPRTKTYTTTWAEIDVSCEACHGPGSTHVRWAEGGGGGADSARGLRIPLSRMQRGEWILHPGASTASMSNRGGSNTQIEVCAPCHSRRTRISPHADPGGMLLDTYSPAVLEDPLYFSDGQIRDEVYVYGSFLQSAMYRAGVVCTDCHDPHNTAVYVRGDSLCYRCHRQDIFGSPRHHFHNPKGDGARCIQCHMPSRTYMQVDARRDHSFRIPRPDLSLTLGTPNACIACHRDRSDRWAASYLASRSGHSKERPEHYGEILHSAREGAPRAVGDLLHLIDRTRSPMIKATAVALLRNYPDHIAGEKAIRVLADPDPLVRTKAIETLDMFPLEERLPVLLPLLSDSVRLVRITAARAVAGVSMESLHADHRLLLGEALDVYRDGLVYNADHPSAHLSLGNLYVDQGHYDDAESEFLRAIELEPRLAPGYLNLADLYRREDRDAEGKKVLLRALKAVPEDPAIHHAFGLLQVRMGETAAAMDHLAWAAEHGRDNPRYSYVYGIALNSTGEHEKAINVLEKARTRHPYAKDILRALVTICRENENTRKAGVYEKALRELEASDPGLSR